MPSTEENQKGIDGYLFRLVATFEAAAMQQMGKLANPLTGDVEVSLEAARDAIEMLDMVKRKTEGNLNEDEGRFLQHVLYQLRMNYVEAAKTGAPGACGDEEREGGKERPEPEQDDDADGSGEGGSG